MHSCLSLATMSDAQVHLLWTGRSGGSYGVTESTIVHAEEEACCLTHAPCVGLSSVIDMVKCAVSKTSNSEI